MWVHSIPRLGRSPGGGHGNSLQYSCLENPMDRGAWRATIHRVAESDNSEAIWHTRPHARGKGEDQPRESLCSGCRKDTTDPRVSRTWFQIPTLPLRDCVTTGHWGRWGQRPLFLVLAFMVITVLWTLILSVLFSKASTERGALLDHQGLLSTNVSKQTAVLGILKEEVRACNSCCLGTQAQLQTVSKELGEARSKLLQQESALKELSERVTQSLAEAGRDRENIRTELFRALEQARLGNSSCKECPESWLPFQGSCYFFSTLRATWVEAQQHCERSGAHLVIVGGLEEQGFLSRNTRGRGYWLGLRAVRKVRRIQGYQWVDGVALSFSHWNRGEPNDSMGREDCIMMLRTGLWNDAPCDNENDNWICEKRLSC